MINKLNNADHPTQKMKFSIKDFFSKCDQISSFLRYWSYLLKKSSMKNFLFCAVSKPKLEMNDFKGFEKLVT